MPNTGMPPHVYLTADKSINHRVQNQVTVILPVVEGKRKAVPLSLKPVYTSADGTGGNAIELAEKIFEDLEEHTGINKSSERLLQIQGRVFDGQYLCEPFTKAMNQPINKLLGGDHLHVLSYGGPCSGIPLISLISYSLHTKKMSLSPD